MPREDELMNFKLVQEIEKYPCLYNYKIPDYHKKSVTDAAWANVAKEVNETVPSCKEKWRNFRTVFARNLKSPRSGKWRKPYYLEEAMQFVLPFCSNKTNDSTGITRNPPPPSREENARSNFDTISGIAQTPTIEISNYNDDSTGAKTTFTAPSSSRKRKRFKQSKVDMAFIDFVNHEMKKARVEEEDSRKLFLLSLLPDIKKLTPNQMRVFRRGVIDALDEALESPQNMLCNSSHNPSIDIQKSTQYKNLVSEDISQQHTD